MSKKWQYFFFLIWLGTALMIALMLFLNGFLLNKTSLRDTSSCVNDSNYMSCQRNAGACSVAQFGNYKYTDQQTCLPQKAKVILVLIDAFRYDFALYNASVPYEHYLNKVPVITELLSTFSNSTRLYKFIANPPTTTMQRLKALTTGTLPTFVDAGSNFATPEINEDNFIDEAARHGKKVVFLGDDTWEGLYPNRFLRNYPYPSFNVHDLDTVDYGINAHIYDEMEKKDWDLLVAHYLGVDHCGHRYGPVHEEMARKLSEMNTVLRNITSKLDENTVLFVVGDHGMTMTGDHGGTSKEEVTAAMFAHSKRPLNVYFGKTIEEVMQIDLVPTISAILGVPVPYSNLGFVITDTLPANYDLPTKIQLVCNNVRQILTYIKHYSQNYNAFDNDALKTFETEYEELNAQLRAPESDFDFDEFLERAEEFSGKIRRMCEKQWTQFNSLDMIRGLLNFFVTAFFVFILVDGIESRNFHVVFAGRHLAAAFSLLLLPLAIYAVLSCSVLAGYAWTACLFSCLGSTGMLAVLVGSNWTSIPEQWYEASKRRRWIDQAARCVLVLSACGLFSNSYIIEESLLLLFSWFSLTTCAIVDVTMPNKNKYRRRSTKLRAAAFALAVLLVVRSSYYFVRCRDEQQWCHGTDFFERFGNSSGYSLFLSVLSTIALVFLTRSWLKRTGNLFGYAFGAFIGNFLPTTTVVLMSSYWIASSAKTALFEPWKLDAIAWGVYSFLATSVASLFAQPLLVDVQMQSDVAKGSIPHIFREIRTRLSKTKAETGDNVPVVCGLGTCYSAAFVSLSLYASLLWAFLLGGSQAAPVALFLVALAFVLVISSAWRFEKASTIRELAEVPNVFIVIWALLGHYFFYASGHQPTFSSIVWDSAFIGFGGALKNIYLQGFLVLVNTFGSHILAGLALPLLLISPYTLQFIKQELRPKRIDPNGDLGRGDVLLYENEEWLFNNACVLSCKYILVSALRVFFSMITATIHCRHLMVWSIFAPKLIFESVALLTTILSVLLSYLLLILVTNKLERFVKSITQKSR